MLPAIQNFKYSIKFKGLFQEPLNQSVFVCINLNAFFMLNPYGNENSSKRKMKVLKDLTWYCLCTWKRLCGKAIYKNQLFYLGVHEWNWRHERFFMPEGINNVHALNPIHEPHPYIMIDHLSYATTWQIHTFNLQKYTKKPPFILPVLTFLAAQNLQ